MMNTLPPLSVYIHWPWCLKKCPYCDFNSHQAPEQLPEERFAQALLSSLERQQASALGRNVSTIFIGGGTPSLMQAKTVERLIEGVYRFYGLSDDCEVTMEANPGTFEYAKFRDFRLAGVNRLSIGIQSFDDRELKVLGRVHTSEQALEAASKAGEIFDNFNIDLMFGLPGQSLGDLEADLNQALACRSTHLSYYQLTIEPNTYFFNHTPELLPDDDLLSDMLDLIEEKTVVLGFEHYEVSAYAKSGKKCRHNLNYWQYGDYIGAGPGAHGKLTTGQGIVRTVSRRDPVGWFMQIASGNAGFSEPLAVEADNIPFEFMLNALRLRQGVPLKYWTERTGRDLAVIEDTLSGLEHKGLITRQNGVLTTTDLGWRFLSDVQESFLKD